LLRKFTPKAVPLTCSQRSATFATYDNLPEAPDEVSTDQATHTTQPPPGDERELNEDLYQNFGSPDLSAPSPPVVPAAPSTSRENTSQLAPYADMQLSMARAKADGATSTYTTPSKRGHKRSATTEISRSSVRKRKLRREDYHATSEQIEEALRSPNRSPTAEHAGGSEAFNSGMQPLGTSFTRRHEVTQHSKTATENHINEDATDASVNIATMPNSSEVQQRNAAFL
ncbi:hypothetical protein CT0861_11019, partial [Colletotrichum tofieldiae]